MNTVLTFVGGLATGFLLAYFKYVLDVEKSRFDFKMKILGEVWGSVLFAKSLSVNLDPVLGEADRDESREDRIRRRLEEFGEAYLKAKRTVRFNELFYPKAIHDLADNVLLEAQLNAKLVGRNASMTGRVGPQSNYWDKVEEFKTKMDSLTDQLSKAIRLESERPSLFPFRCGRVKAYRVSERPDETQAAESKAL